MDLLSILGVVLLVCLTTIVLYVLYMSKDYRLFSNVGIPTIKPWPALGSFPEINKGGFIGFHLDQYKNFQGEKVYGYFEANQPVLAIRDLDMLRDIMVKNFNCFTDRRSFTNEEPLNHSLNNLEGDHWRHVRNTVSPTFTSGKLKKMCSNVEGSARTMRDNLLNMAGKEMELKDMMSCFAMDVIASTGFGVTVDSLKDPSNVFFTEAKNMLDISNAKVALAVVAPWLFKLLNKWGMGVFPKQSVNFFTSFVDAALKNRVESGVSNQARNDFIQLVVDEGRKVEGANKTIDENSGENGSNVEKKKGLSHIEFQGQAFIFIIAGYDTVSTTLSFLFFLLAHNPQHIAKVQEEIDDVLQGQFPTYESVQKLIYLDMCVNETMRLYPAGFVIDRRCTQDCVVQGISIKKGTTVLFPFMAIFRDPNLFPDPETFDPERHSAENKAARHPFAFLPFGNGPRNCIGMRLALLEMKIAIAAILQKLTPVPTEKSVNPPNLTKFQMKATDGLYVKFVERKEQ